MAQHSWTFPLTAIMALLAFASPHAVAAAAKTDATKVLLVKRQYGKAAKALAAAAEAGDAKAQFQLAGLYRLGLGVDADRSKAIYWYRKAAAQGHAKSARVLERMTVAVPPTEKKLALRNDESGSSASAAAGSAPVPLPGRAAPAQDWLSLAAARDLAPAVAALLQAAPDKASLALSAAAEANRPASAAAAMAAGADSSVTVKGSETALSLAVRPGREQLLASLLAPDAAAKLSPTAAADAFDAAARFCNGAALQALTAAHLKMDGTSTEAAIDVVKTCATPESLLALLDPALLAVTDADGRNSLWHAARSGSASALAWLLAARVDPLSPDSAGLTSAHAAALGANAGSLALILKAAPQPGPSKDGVTPLMLAAASGCTDCLAQLLATGEDVNAKDEAGNTALMYAVRTRQTEAIRALLKAGANDGSRNENGDTPAKLFARLRKP